MVSLHLKSAVIGVAICFAVGAVLHWLAHLPFWISLLLAAVAMLLNGILAEWEDKQPGGFLDLRASQTSNPDLGKPDL